MLTAHTAEGELVILTRSQSLESLRERRKQESFYCPQCKEQLILKVGDLVIPHFAHYQQSSCRNSFSEGESPAHLLGKSQLYEFFSHHTPAVKLEPFLPDIQQRPDLLVVWGDTEVPVEFQCSTISTSLVRQRNAGYYLLNMLPVWIILTPQSIQTSTADILTLRLSSFLQFFIRQIPNRMSVLLTYHPQSERFYYLSPIIHLQGSTYAARHLTLSLHKQTVPFSLPSSPSQTDIRELALHYQSARRKYLRTVIAYNQKGIHNQFLRACYEMRIQPVQLPAWIGVPVQGQEAFRQSDCEWQLLFVAAVRETRKSPDQLNTSFFHTFIKQFDGEPDDLLAACRSYGDFLREERIDIYRMDRFTDGDFVYEVLSGRFLAMYAKN
ncbi:competence protein CoiA [Sporosarcina cascadiensis]|uniref:competence protein CoiA n=1 Tax=Sporosarcina cascadiensis TaxID=2660747 RepID=UPI001890D577|nr:competence protein CoiA family protein [Sporosarcina cascadiensis]